MINKEDFSGFETLLTERVGDHVLLITLNRPSVGNAFNTLMGQELEILWNALISDTQGVRCAVLTGAGERVFCAGADLKERNTMNSAQWQKQHEIFERQYFAMIDVPIPVIGAINGHAYAGGLEMALCCDFLYAANHVRFALTEVTLGIMPGAGGTQNLPRALGDRRAKEIIFSGKPFSAEQALDWGLVNQLFEPDQLLQAALESAQGIAGNAPLSVRQSKRSIRYGSQMELKTAYRFEIEAYNHLINTQDRVEGIKAFNEKRKPVFTGK